MAFSIVQGEPTGMSNPAPMAEVGPKPTTPQSAGLAPGVTQESADAGIRNNGLNGVPGANPTANYRRFDVDGGEGSMGHHWAGVERGQE
jgi:hypothetical protein